MNQERILVVGLNWIGDAIMSMPAVQACRAENPDARITLLVKPYLKPLWEMHAVPDEILCMKDGAQKTIRMLRNTGFDKALILPNSFRSAYLPFMGGVPRRVGLRGQLRSLMLTEVIPLSSGHQSNEYYPILAPSAAGQPHELPRLSIPSVAFAGVQQQGDYVVLMPGAARGASKMWPLGHFEKLALRLLSETDLSIVFSGGPGDATACNELSEKLGERAMNLAGSTSLQEWAALLKQARVAIANDSGGMHLAAAAGTPVVGIYGITDPEKTGPLATSFRILQNSSVKSRDIARDSALARKALESITQDQVFEAASQLL
jgi:heptosyltransferase-2